MADHQAEAFDETAVLPVPDPGTDLLDAQAGLLGQHLERLRHQRQSFFQTGPESDQTAILGLQRAYRTALSGGRDGLDHASSSSAQGRAKARSM